MIEVIYKEDTTEQETAQESFSMPRNVRQIGLANGDYRIYIEDYVYTFLCSLAEDEKPEGQGSVAVLTYCSYGTKYTSPYKYRYLQYFFIRHKKHSSHSSLTISITLYRVKVNLPKKSRSTLSYSRILSSTG